MTPTALSADTATSATADNRTRLFALRPGGPAYWTGLLGGEQPVLELPFDRPRPARQSHRGAQLGFELSRELVEAVRALAQREGASSFMLLLASFQALLYRYSGQADIRVGVPIANRISAYDRVRPTSRER